MKSYRFYAMALFIIASLITIIIGCKYNVAEPAWYGPPPASANVSIATVIPAQAVGGVNTITITGNLIGALDSTKVPTYTTDTVTVKVIKSIINNDTTWGYTVATKIDSSALTFVHNGIYFNGVQATVVSYSPTAITVLRPNVVSDSCTIAIASNKSVAMAKYGPYKITAVEQSFGGFTTNVPLSTITLDMTGNMYVIDATLTSVSTSPVVNNYLYTLWKITPDGNKTQLGYLGGETPHTQLTKPLPVTDAKINPIDGKLYYLQSVKPTFVNSKDVHVVDLNSSPLIDTVWLKQISKKISYGDFDANGYFYTGGTASGIVVIRPNRSLRIESYHTTDTILSMRVFNNYIYVATRTGITRNSISDTSQLGPQEPVLDFTQTAFASLPFSGFAFSADGNKMYIGTYSKNPILIADGPSTGLPISPSSVAILYQGILPTYCDQVCFGPGIGSGLNGSGFYMISGNTTVSPAVNWIVYQIDVGTNGAPYY